MIKNKETHVNLVTAKGNSKVNERDYNPFSVEGFEPGVI